MLSKNERERLHEIERQFADENPQFVKKFAKVPALKRIHRILAWSFFALAMFSMTSSAGLYGAITVLVITFIVIAVAPIWRRHAARDRQIHASEHGDSSIF